jgi:ABC-type antimicrobial peptide transport system permease subunit
MLLAAVFAAIALTLASVGVYGVVQYGVLKRRQEFALRVALGASRGAVLGLVMRDGVRLALVGLSIGVAGALLVTPLLAAQLFGVSPLDPLSYAIVVPVLALVALSACLIPAWRALAVSPVEGLRRE